MLPRISATDYERCYPKRLKKIFQSNLNMHSYNKFIPHIVGGGAIVGNIPPELIKLFPKETRGEDIKKFQGVLADITKYLRASWNKKGIRHNLTNPFTYRHSDLVNSWIKQANTLLNACLKRFPQTPMTGNLEYIDYGVAGKVFRLSIMDKDGNKIMHDKALKVYHNVIHSPDALPDMHGSYAEANIWTYLKRAVGHKFDKTQFTKHYISDLHNGYSLTEFIDENITRTTAKVDFQNLFRIKYSDGHHNPRLHGKIYDVGGFQKYSKFMDDKVVLRYFKKLFFRSKRELPEVLARYEALAQNPKTPHRDKIQRAISLFKKE